jgi:pfkB family carbohydrate kinase
MPVIMINMPVSGLSRYMAAMLWGRVGGGAGTSPRRAGDRRRNSAADLRDIPGLRSIQLFGTKAANVALLAQRLGVPARLFGRTGDDALREQALAPLRDAGLDLAGVSIAAGCATAVAMIAVLPDGKKTPHGQQKCRRGRCEAGLLVRATARRTDPSDGAGIAGDDEASCVLSRMRIHRRSCLVYGPRPGTQAASGSSRSRAGGDRLLGRHGPYR